MYIQISCEFPEDSEEYANNDDARAFSGRQIHIRFNVTDEDSVECMYHMVAKVKSALMDIADVDCGYWVTQLKEGIYNVYSE